MTYAELSLLPPSAYLDPETFKTPYDGLPPAAYRDGMAAQGDILGDHLRQTAAYYLSLAAKASYPDRASHESCSSHFLAALGALTFIPSMDPDTCLDSILLALASGDLEEAGDRADDLLEWLRGGGFCPRATAHQEISGALSLAGFRPLPGSPFPDLLFLLVPTSR